MTIPSPYTVHLYNDAPFYTERVSQALQRVCTPWDQANHGDILALMWHLRYDKTVEPYPVQGALTLHTEGTTRTLVHTFFQDLEPRHTTSFALAAAQLHIHDEVSINTLGRHCRSMEAPYLIMMAMPTMAAILHVDTNTHLDAHQRVTQANLDKTLRILANPPVSKHDALVQHRCAQQMLTMARMWYTLLDYDGSTIPLQVGYSHTP